LFNAGVRPAINVGLSVSRVGGNAQIKAMRQVAGSLRLDLAQYRALEAFTQFGSELDKATQAQLARGQRLTEVLKQEQFVPLPVEKQVLIIFTGTNGYLDNLEVDDCLRFERELYEFMDTNYSALMAKLAKEKKIDDALREEIKTAVGAFQERFAASGEKAAD